MEIQAGTGVVCAVLVATMAGCSDGPWGDAKLTSQVQGFSGNPTYSQHAYDYTCADYQGANAEQARYITETEFVQDTAVQEYMKRGVAKAVILSYLEQQIQAQCAQDPSANPYGAAQQATDTWLANGSSSSSASPSSGGGGGGSGGTTGGGTTGGGSGSGSSQQAPNSGGQYDAPVCDDISPHYPCHQGDRNGPLLTGPPQTPGQSGSSGP